MSKTPINAILKCKSNKFLNSSAKYIYYSIGLAVCDMLVMIEYIPYTCHQYIVKSGKSIEDEN